MDKVIGEKFGAFDLYVAKGLQGFDVWLEHETGLLVCVGSAASVEAAVIDAGRVLGSAINAAGRLNIVAKGRS